MPELARPAATFALAGEEGATVSKALEAQAEALRSTILSEDKAHANQATEKMVLPTLVTAFIMLIFVGYPAFYAHLVRLTPHWRYHHAPPSHQCCRGGAPATGPGSEPPPRTPDTPSPSG
ncbi:hypothetical protein SANTM175S_03316 [Streptomyces antimycoticus]